VAEHNKEVSAMKTPGRAWPYRLIAGLSMLAVLVVALGFWHGIQPTQAQSVATLAQLDQPAPIGTPGSIIRLHFQLTNNFPTTKNYTITVSNMPADVVATNPGAIMLAPTSSTTFFIDLRMPSAIVDGHYSGLVSATEGTSTSISTFGQFQITGSPPPPTATVTPTPDKLGCSISLPMVIK